MKYLVNIYFINKILIHFTVGRGREEWKGSMTPDRRSAGPRPGDPTGGGRAGGPRKYPPVGREGIGTSTVVRGK